jgi:ABC-2 type transport system ATP-binding protein
VIHGNELGGLTEKLKEQPGVEQTVLFGTKLHVSGKDVELLERTLRRVIAGSSLQTERIDTTLEDVFIYMMKKAADNGGVN